MASDYRGNMNVARILTVGSSKSNLQTLALPIFEACLQFDIRLTAQWIPREGNTIEDDISQYYDADNWSTDDWSFYFYCSAIRLMQYRRCNIVDSLKFHCPQTRASMLSAAWGLGFHCSCPPISLIGYCYSSAFLLTPAPAHQCFSDFAQFRSLVLRINFGGG